jgi:hypothetical protein
LVSVAGDHGGAHAYLGELATARIYEFLFVALPIAFAGATGASLHPVAIA